MPASSDTTDFSYVTPAAPDTADLTGATSSNSAGSLFSATTTGLQTLDIVLTNILSDNKKIAFEPYNNQFTLSDGTTGYSALHYATSIEITGLDALANVTISSVADNQLLQYDSSSSKWINGKLVFNNIDAAVAVTESEGIGSNDNDTTFPTSAAVKDYVDTNVTAQDLDFSGDSGGAQSIDLDSQSLTLTGGTGIDTTGSSQTMTFAIDSTVATLAGSQTLTNKTLTSPVLNTGVSGTAVLDSDTMSGASATTLSTSESIKAYVDSQVATHDQLSELTDVTITGTPADNELLAYDTSASKWINQTSAEANLQPLDAGLTSISGLTTAADKMIYTTGSDTYAVTALTSAGRAILDDADAAAQRTTLGLGTVSTLDVGISNNNIAQFTSGVADNDFLKIDGTAVEGRSSAEVLSDIGAITASSSDTLTNKSIDSDNNTITNIVNADIKSTAAIANSKLANSSITVSDGSSSTATALGGTITFAGTTNEVEVGESSGTVTVGLPNNVTISGNLTVSGTTTTVNTETLSVEDPLIKLANNNSSSDAVDIGFYGLYDTSGSQDLYAGLFRDANDSGKFKLFKDLQAEPTTTVNTGGTGYAAGTLVANLEGNVTGNVTGTASTATVATTVTITDNESTDEDNAIIFTSGGDVDGGNIGLESDGDLTYNPSTGRLTATQLAGTLQTAAQTNITSLGTISSLSAGTITTSGNIELGHANDTTISRSAAGTVQIEGNTILTFANADAPATVSSSSEVDHLLVNDGGVLKKSVVANLGVATTDDITALAIALG